MTFSFHDDADEAQKASQPAEAARHTILWLIFWFVIALIIRLSHLTLKAAWMDEVATTLFSLGNYSKLIPLNEIISLDQLLRPLQITPGATVNDVVTHLLVEDNHPPTYFVLAHWWMALFPRADGYASLWAARALPAIFGALAVPATYLLAWLSFRDRLIGLLCAALMAVSPFSVFLSQEARHYTLAILAVIASLCCFVLAVQSLKQRQPLAWLTVFSWIVINTVGLTIHFFCGLSLISEGIAILGMLIQQSWRDRELWRSTSSIRIYSAAAGTLAGALLWLPILTNFYGSPQTSFLKAGEKSWQYWVNPIVQSLASWLYVVLSPVTRGYSWQAVVAIVISCVILLVYAIWLVASLQGALKFQLRQSDRRIGIQAIGGFFIAANVLFLLICYALSFDITRGHRYSFVFFPSLIVIVGACLAPFWQETVEKTATRHSNFSYVKLPLTNRLVSQKPVPKRALTAQTYSRWAISGQTFVALVIAVAFVGAQFIVNDLSSLKFYKADRLVGLIQANSTLPVVIGANAAITEQPTVIGIEIMSVAWEIQRNFNPKAPSQQWNRSPLFVIAEDNANQAIQAEAQLRQSLKAIAHPFDLWLLGMSPDLSQEDCTIPSGGQGNKGSFNYTHYVCQGRQ